ncbi:MAG: radical SAM/SPASM domain protein maturase [Desulfobacterales bacterium]|nr:radical SAM/SPASM domain protein maturase [Desulfobacterales bacterium]
MNRYVESRYNIQIPLKNDRALVYNAFTGGLALWEANEKQVFEKIRNMGQPEPDEQDQKPLKDLVYGGFIVEKDMDERKILEEKYRLARFAHNILTLTIAPTMICNFACDYCYQGQDKENTSMSREIQDSLIALAERAGPGIRHLSVAWYGGEPLLKKDIIYSLSERFIRFCDSRNMQYSASMVTNGYLLDEETIHALERAKLRQIQVTFDGPPEHHDARRVLHSGGSTFDRIVSNLRDVVDNTLISFSIRVNVDSRNIEDIPKLFDLLEQKGLNNKTNFKLYFSPVESMTKGCHDVEGLCLGKLGYGYQEAEFYRTCIEKGLTGNPYPPRFHGACAAAKPKGFVALPNGDLHKCWHTTSRPERRIGTLFDLDSIRTDDTYSAWLDWNPFQYGSCFNCKLLPVCTGSCGYKFLYTEDLRGEGASFPCISWRYNIKERLLLNAEKNNVITHDDYDPDQIRTKPEEIGELQYLCAKPDRS